eukprot:CAMPEP_0197062586 /NCGR_PEP_ID=MMETSP1384-20130603/146195_1 /TAXON_ID=29189 /ORGANISM="Ammonia sp." /LENGTH=121 /DNA_ID=CAMNT_0042498609 /DNA_START=27 /DNA_END=389 /DNA_ORIENTATION=+
MICFAINNVASFHGATRWRKRLKDAKLTNRDVVVVLVGCKGDYATHNRQEYEVTRQEIMKDKEWKKYHTSYCECSAKTGDNVASVFNHAAELILEHIVRKKRNNPNPKDLTLRVGPKSKSK